MIILILENLQFRLNEKRKKLQQNPGKNTKLRKN